METRRSPRRAAALAAARRGWPVFPLMPFTKIPAIEGWEDAASCDTDQIEDWWFDQPYANVGIACGPARLVIVDLDAAHGAQPPPPWDALGVAQGRDVLRILAEQAGEPDPIDTYTVRSPRDGEHRYFTLPEGAPTLRNTNGTRGRGLGWHIDTRASGGQIVAAGSAARIEGRRAHYWVARARPVAPLPDWLLERLTPFPEPEPSELEPVRWSLPSNRAEAYVNAALRGEFQAVQTAQPGSRADTLFWAGVSLGSLVGMDLLDEALARDTLTTAAAGHHGVEGFSAREAAGHITRGLDWGRRRPRRRLPTTMR